METVVTRPQSRGLMRSPQSMWMGWDWAPDLRFAPSGETETPTARTKIDQGSGLPRRAILPPLTKTPAEKTIGVKRNRIKRMAQNAFPNARMVTSR